MKSNTSIALKFVLLLAVAVCFTQVAKGAEEQVSLTPTSLAGKWSKYKYPIIVCGALLAAHGCDELRVWLQNIGVTPCTVEFSVSALPDTKRIHYHSRSLLKKSLLWHLWNKAFGKKSDSETIDWYWDVNDQGRIGHPFTIYSEGIDCSVSADCANTAKERLKEYILQKNKSVPLSPGDSGRLFADAREFVFASKIFPDILGGGHPGDQDNSDVSQWLSFTTKMALKIKPSDAVFTEAEDLLKAAELLCPSIYDSAIQSTVN